MTELERDDLKLLAREAGVVLGFGVPAGLALGALVLHLFGVL